MRAWPIPVKSRKSCFHTHRILVMGDAAGLTDPLTGEGISYAIRSGKIAALGGYEFLQGKKETLRHYSEEINEFLMPEILEASRVKAIFNAAPFRIHRLVRDRERAWNAFGKVLRGERNYQDVKRGFGRWKFLWRIASILPFRMIEKIVYNRLT